MVPRPTDLGNPLLWFMMSVAAIVGSLALCPFNVWIARRKFTSWPIWLTAGQDTSGETAALPSLQSTWAVLLLSFVLFVGSLGLMAIDMPLPRVSTTLRMCSSFRRIQQCQNEFGHRAKKKIHQGQSTMHQ